jgi:hypothetical protein
LRQQFSFSSKPPSQIRFVTPRLAAYFSTHAVLVYVAIWLSALARRDSSTGVLLAAVHESEDGTFET